MQGMLLAARGLRGRLKDPWLGCAGHQTIDYFNGLPLAGEGMVLEALEEGNNEAEWIVDVTTQADRQNKCVRMPCAHPQPCWEACGLTPRARLLPCTVHMQPRETSYCNAGRGCLRGCTRAAA